jgi:hypothetical protein
MELSEQQVSGWGDAAARVEEFELDRVEEVLAHGRPLVGRVSRWRPED